MTQWDIDHANAFRTSLYELRKNFATVGICDPEGKQVSSIKINMYLLATGPFHQDFAVPLPDAPHARLSFDLRISQSVKMRVKVNEAELVPKDREYPGDTFAFCLRAIVSLGLAS